MDLFPAIDVRAGRVVRMRRRDASSEIVYDNDPLAVAERYAGDGARWVHLVDLDRVFGFGAQTGLIADVARRVPVRLQVGGGLATAGEVGSILGCGVERVIVRAAAARQPGGFGALAGRFGGARLAVAVDARDGMVDLGEGAGAARVPAVGLVREATVAGIRTIVYTDLAREGRLGGADVVGAASLARDAGADVIVSGGVGALEELERIRDAGLAGAVVGRALLEGRFTLREALACSSSP
jgi:phosphoribosylformimino-5-aminoimidazole carboxamide ribotide isomerase